jgi:AcrR family transcriptional regulator
MAIGGASTRASKGERTRQRLLDLAVEAFATAGYQGTTVSAIARQAGLTPAAAYAYFPGKVELFEAAVDLDAAALVEEAFAQLPPGPPRTRLLSLVASLVDGLERHPLARRVMAGREPEVTGRLLGLPALVRVRQTTAAELAAGQEAGTVRADVDPHVLAMGLQTIVLALLMALLQVASADPDALAERQASVLAVLDAALAPAASSI